MERRSHQKRRHPQPARHRQALENFKRLPTAEADFQIIPAEGQDARPGESDIIIEWNQSKPVRFNLSIDDSGSKYTGKYQGNATLSLDHTFQPDRRDRTKNGWYCNL